MRLPLLLLALLIPLAASGQKPPPPAGKAAAAGTRITWLGHAAFLIQTPGGTNLLIDPWLENPKAPKGVRLPAKIDAILVSHGHADHVGQTADLLKRTGAKLIAPAELAGLLGAKEPGGNVGGSFEVGDATIYMTEAVHSSSLEVGGRKEYAGSPVGFVIRLKNGPRLYHAGDTGLFDGFNLVRTQHAPQIALLPIGGHFTMGPDDAATAVSLLGVKTVVPMHFGTFPLLKGTPAQLRDAMKRQKVPAEVRELEPGKTAAF